MVPKLERLNRLLSEGYELLDIMSDHRRIRADLARGALRVSVEFDREDARRILYGDARPAIGRASRYRVTAPLR